jgi:kynurenine formamidase
MFIDLSVLLNEQTPVYPGDPNTVIKAAGVLEKDGWCDHYVSVGTHVGTHIDAPMHMIKDGKSLETFELEQFAGSAKCIDVSAGFDVVKTASIKEGSIVLFYTKMSEQYFDAAYYENYPVMSQEIAKFLVSKKLKMIGVDACSVDNNEDFPIHKILLGNDVLIIENLTNLGQLIDKDFKLYAFPLKLGIDGAPTRVVAEV